jgi:hypothetical protein
MDNPTSYDADILAWSERQASVLRDLARTRRDLPNDLDLENVAEEIECVGRSELAAVQSFVRQILVHVIKAASVEDPGLVKHWRGEAVAFHASIFDHLSPSMIDRVATQHAWEWAVRTADAQLGDYQQDVIHGVPTECPFSLEELVARDFDFLNAVERLRNAAGHTGQTRKKGPRLLKTRRRSTK